MRKELKAKMLLTFIIHSIVMSTASIMACIIAMCINDPEFNFELWIVEYIVAIVPAFLISRFMFKKGLVSIP